MTMRTMFTAVLIGATTGFSSMPVRAQKPDAPAIKSAEQTPLPEKFWPFAVKLADEGRVLEVEGEIDFAAIKPFRELVESTPQLERIVLNSPGGTVIAAEVMATAVRKRGLKTHVSQVCVSACTLIFLSGKNRTMDADAMIGFHQASTRGFDTARTVRKIDGVDSIMARLYLKNGLSKAFVDRILATPFDDMMVPGSEELLAEKVLTAAPETQLPK